MPPPNLTGELHLGHAMMDTVEDILVRWRRMQGRETLWLPGVDHAAIAVHTLIERQLAAEGINRRDIGREAFLERTWEFVNRNRAAHLRPAQAPGHQRRLVAREASPWTPARRWRCARSSSTCTSKGLIYSGNRLINWCPG